MIADPEAAVLIDFGSDDGFAVASASVVAVAVASVVALAVAVAVAYAVVDDCLTLRLAVSYCGSDYRA